MTPLARSEELRALRNCILIGASGMLRHIQRWGAQLRMAHCTWTALRSSIGHFAQDRLNPIRGDVSRPVRFAWLCPALKEQTQPHAGVNQLEHERFRRALATRSFS